MAESENNEPTEAPSIEAQAQAQTGQQQIRLRIDQKSMSTTYANAFRSSTTAEEVMLDFGLNQVIQARPAGEAQPNEPVGEILFDINNRIVLNYYTAKRLAITIGQIIRRYEDQFGELKLNVADRATGASN
ncbi:MAG: hypothetical protein CMJ18_06220 [Phycisphaeraceae bacterium]|nr:hypothetical protein [Phycisphaeraceae bacterium]